MSRQQARENCFKLIYEYLFTDTVNEELFIEFSGGVGINEDDKTYCEKVYKGVIENIKQLTETIEKYAEDFKLNRIYKVDLAILLLAAYEIIHFEAIPAAVSCNEAVELTKKYSTQSSPAYVNGILASIVKEFQKP